MREEGAARPKRCCAQQEDKALSLSPSLQHNNSARQTDRRLG